MPKGHYIRKPRAPATPTPKLIPAEKLRAVEKAWRERATTLRMKRKTIGYAKAQVEFFAGAMHAFVVEGYDIPAYWVICLQSGRDPAYEGI